MEIMKKVFRFLNCLATMVVAASCLEEMSQIEGQEGELVQMTFSAVMDEITTSDKTKTSLGTDFTVTWDEEESISIFSGATHTEFVMYEKSEDGKSAKFRGETMLSSEYHAVYPYSSEYSTDAEGTITLNLAYSQPAKADGFGHGVNLSAATSSSTDLQFRNVGALIGFTMGNDNIKSVVLAATEDNQYLAGKATLQFTGGLPEVTVTEGCASVTLNGDFVKGDTYYFVVYPGSYTNLKITYVDADGKTASKSNPNTLTLERNGNVTFGTMTMTDLISYTGVEDLFIGGEGAEAGQQFTYVNTGYYDTSLSTYGDNFPMDMPYYEIHTQLKADKSYYFYGLDGEKPLYVSAVDFAPVEDEASASTTVAEDGLYRIRINTTTGEVVAKKISRMYFLHLWIKYQVDFDYVGKGVWSKNFKMEVDENGQWRDERYKFVVEFADGSIQHYGANHNDDNRHRNPESAPEGYFDIQMTATSEWDGKFKITEDYHRQNATITVYLNNEKGHYTHEFSLVQ